MPGTHQLVAKVDRVVLYSFTALQAAARALVLFKTLSDFRPLASDGGPTWGAYQRVRWMISDATGTKVTIKYRPRHAWRMPPLRVEVYPDDLRGLRRTELEDIANAFATNHFANAEMTVDALGDAIEAEFVRRYAKCGKARMRPNKKYPHAVWFGTPRSHWFARFYPKPQVGGFRSEIQFNSPALKRANVVAPKDFVALADVVIRMLGFYEVNWPQLQRHMLQDLRQPYGELLFRKAQTREDELTKLLAFLRKVSISNPERFLMPLPINQEIVAALRRWKRNWRRKTKKGAA